MSSIRDSYKKPQIDGGSFKKPFPLVEGKNLFRVIHLPQIHADGKWFRFAAQHFGYKVLDRDGKESMRTFLCPRDYNSKTKVERHPCAECHKIEREDDLLTRSEVQYKDQGLTPEQIATKTMARRDWLNAHNRDTKYFVHVMNTNGEFSYVKLGSTAFYEMKDRIRELEAAGIDAFDPNQGVWFSVNKTGKVFSTKYSTTVEMEVEVVNGRKMQTEKLAPLSEEQLEHAIRECPPFDGLVPVISDTQVEQLASSTGSPEEVSAILGANVSRRESSPTPVPAAARQVRQAELEESAAVAAPVSPPIQASRRGEPLADYTERVKAGIGANAIPTAKAAVPPPVDDEEAQILAQLAAVRAAKAASSAPAQTPVRAPAKFDARDPSTPAEDFISQFGEE